VLDPLGLDHPSLARGEVTEVPDRHRLEAAEVRMAVGGEEAVDL